MNPGIGELIAAALILLMSGLGMLFSPRLSGYLLMEDLPPEWFEFFCLALGAWLWAKASASRWRGRAWLGLGVCGGLTILCAFVAGEEISWGQRIFGYQTPTYFAQRNVQHEVTVHNLTRQLVEPRQLAILIMASYGIIFPLLASMVRPLARLANRLGIPIPRLGTAVCFGLAIWLMRMPFTATDDEVGEVFFSLGMLGAAMAAVGINATRRVLGLLSILGVLSVVVSALCFLRPAHRDQVLNVGHLKAAQVFEGRGMKTEAAREYELLALRWSTDWDLWIRVITMYQEAGDLCKAYELSRDFIHINKRQWRPFEVMAEVGRVYGMEEEVRQELLAVLRDEPYNDYARWALLLLEGKRPFYDWREQGIGNRGQVAGNSKQGIGNREQAGE